MKWYENCLSAVPRYDPREKERNIEYHIRYMLDRTQRMFEYQGLPDSIPARILELYLQVNGHVAFAEHEGSLYVYTGSMGGEPDVYYRSTLYTVANPAQAFSKNFRIGEECIVAFNDSLYLGLIPLFRRYASALVENELSLHIVDINSRIMSLISASDDRTIASAKKVLDDIERGELGVIAENAFLEGLKALPLTTSGKSVLLDLMEYEQYLKSQWYNAIGLDSNYNMKRERLNLAEVEMNNDSLAPFIDDMLECRKKALEDVNAMFGTDITVDLASAWKQNVEETEMLLDAMKNGEMNPDGEGAPDAGDAAEDEKEKEGGGEDEKE